MKVSPFALMILLCCTGCGLIRPGPDYQRPCKALPPIWEGLPSSVNAIASPAPPLTAWWEVFADPLLSTCIEEAACFNQELLVAKATVLQAVAISHITAAAFFPQIGVNQSDSTIKLSSNSKSLLPGFPSIKNVTVETSQLLATANWNLDLFGKTSRQLEAANAQTQMAVENERDLLIQILSNVAQSYVKIRFLQEKDLLLRQELAFLEEAITIVHAQKAQGLATQLQVEQTEAKYFDAATKLPPIQAAIYQEIYLLSVLTGKMPQALVCKMFPYVPLSPLPSRQVAVGIPSTLLCRRPDIRAAERRLAQATANIGVAVASFFPNINLLATGGYRAFQIFNLLNIHGLSGSFSESVTLPIFSAGALVGQLKLSKAEAVAAAYHYNSTLLKALAEVEGALVGYGEALHAEEESAEYVERIKRLYLLKKAEAKSGLIGSLPLLDQGVQWITAELNHVDTRAAIYLNLIDLYKALGGGWEHPFPIFPLCE